MGQCIYYLKAEFWKAFCSKFPLVVEMLKGVRDPGHVKNIWNEKALVLETDPGNALSGHINFGSEDDLNHALSCDKYVLRFEAEVWHMAEWDTLCKFLKKKFGAVKAGWISEEGICLSDAANAAIKLH